MFQRVMTALITPFQDGQVDLTALEKLIDWQIQEGMQGLVMCGTTGEGFFLSPVEHAQVLKTAVTVAQKRIPIIAGIGALTTAQALILCQQAEEAGVDGLMFSTPPYVRPSQEHLYQYFKTLHDATQLPIIIYDNPSRSGVSIQNELVIRLAELARIVALKDSSGDIDRPLELLPRIPEKFHLVAGNDHPVAAFYAQGGHGLISVAANIAPALAVQQHRAWLAGQRELFLRLTQQWGPIARCVVVEPSPTPLKFALSQMGFCKNEVRAPLQPITAASEAKVLDVLKQYGIVSPEQRDQHRRHG